MPDKALLVGINNYKSISDLRGCLNDVKDIRQLLIEVFGFSSQNIRTLTDDRATKQQIGKQWHWLCAEAHPGDRLVFHFAGHGSQVVDEDGDEPDGLDEILCLYDMDWNSPSSYLVDDDLYKLTKRVPKGALLTVILDSCHSGTATRLLLTPEEARSAPLPSKTPLVDLDTTVARLSTGGGDPKALLLRDAGPAIHKVLAPADGHQNRDTVLVRFVEPPPQVFAALRRDVPRHRILSLDQERGTKKMNHVLLAGSKSTQACADAYIDGDYHGAFSYFLCRTIRESGDTLDHQDLIHQVRQVLTAERFSQEPQLEPENTRGPLLRWGKKRPQSQPDRLADGQGRRIQELLDLVREIKQLLQAGWQRQMPTDRTAGESVLVYVHGIGRHAAGYSDPWWQSLRPYLSPAVQQAWDSGRREVVWSDLVTATREVGVAAEPRDSEREQELADRLREVLDDRAQGEQLSALPTARADERPRETPQLLAGIERGIWDFSGIDDFVKYLLYDSVRNAVQQRFLDQTVPALERGMMLEVISHSWGTIVAYEALRRLDNRTFAGHVHNLFTVGSALSIAPVQHCLRPMDGRRPRCVQRWLNLDARGDLVGGPLRSRFQVDKEYLNLQPAGCESTAGWVSPICAHSSYFHSTNTAVNRHLFAGHIEG